LAALAVSTRRLIPSLAAGWTARLAWLLLAVMAATASCQPICTEQLGPVHSVIKLPPARVLQLPLETPQDVEYDPTLTQYNSPRSVLAVPNAAGTVKGSNIHKQLTYFFGAWYTAEVC